MHEIRIDRGKPLSAEPHVGHNRYWSGPLGSDRWIELI